MLNAQIIKEKSRELGADLVGIGNIAHYDGCNPQRDPKSILPDATCVIGFGFRIPRALYRVMDDKNQFYNYTQLGVKAIDEELSEIFLLRMGALIENEGYDVETADNGEDALEIIKNIHLDLVILDLLFVNR